MGQLMSWTETETSGATNRGSARTYFSSSSVFSVSSVVRKSSSHSVGIQQYLARLAGLQTLHALAEILQRHTIGDYRREVKLAGLEQRLHLVPGLIHQAAVDALHDCAFKDQVFGDVHLDRNRRDTKQGDTPAEAQNVESCLDAIGMSGHLEHHVDSSAICTFEDKLLHVALA